MGSGMQSKGVHQISNDIVTALKEYFNDRIEGFTIYDITDIPYPMFSIRFSLKNSQPWFDKVDLDVLCKELDENVRIRIPDKYLAYYNWGEESKQ